MTTAKSVAGKELKELLVSLIMIRLHEVGDRLQTHLTLIGHWKPSELLHP